MTQVWHEQPVLHRRKFFQGRAIRGTDIKDISWFEPSGQEMSDAAWDAGFVKCLGVRLAGDLIGDVDERSEPIRGDTLLILLNAHHEELPFQLPPTLAGQHWELVFDTAHPQATAGRVEGEQRLSAARPIAGRLPHRGGRGIGAGRRRRGCGRASERRRLQRQGAASGGEGPARTPG